MDLYWSHEELDAEVRVGNIVMKEPEEVKSKGQNCLESG